MKKLLLSVAICLLFGAIAQAATINLASQLTGSTTVIDFSQFTGANQYIEVNGPVQIGGNIGMDVRASANNESLYLFDDSWGLLNNGTWDSGKNGYLGIWPDNGPVTIDFISAISGFGAFMNYIDGGGYSSNISISAYDSSNNLLETFNVLTDPISTPNGINSGAFRGILRNTSDIASIQFYGQGVVLDDLTFQSTTAAVPEPGTIMLLGVGMAGLAIYAKRRKNNKFQ